MKFDALFSAASKSVQICQRRQGMAGCLLNKPLPLPKNDNFFFSTEFVSYPAAFAHLVKFFL